MTHTLTTYRNDEVIDTRSITHSLRTSLLESWMVIDSTDTTWTITDEDGKVIQSSTDPLPGYTVVSSGDDQETREHFETQEESKKRFDQLVEDSTSMWTNVYHYSPDGTNIETYYGDQDEEKWGDEIREEEGYED